jgi:predicted ATPase
VWFGTGIRFDVDAGRLWRDGDEVALRPKTAAVLAYLVDRAGEVVSKRELLDAVWPDGFVGDAVLVNCVLELRAVFGDDPKEPAFIATAHRRGYRFVAPLSATPDSAGGGPGPLFVGRDAELAQLEEWWRLVRRGTRQVVFVAAQAGVGKTALVDAFVDRLRDTDSVVVGWGQCVEQFGEGEPYLPIFDALAGLCRGGEGRRVVDVLAAMAPTWPSQLPGVVGGEALEALRALTVGMSAERMLRELAVALEALTVERPLVLVCEDLHLSDRATTELLGYLARRREAAQLLVFGTYRPAEVASAGHPLRQVVGELRAHEQCRFVPLELLDQPAVNAYLSERLAPRRPSETLVDDIFERSDGNALFVATIVDHLIGKGLLVDVAGAVRSTAALDRLGIPDSVGAFIDQQLDDLATDDRRLLEVAAAVGVEFTTEAVRAAAVRDAAEVDARLADLARATGVVVEGDVIEWPDGTLTGSYRFRHGLYQEVLYGHLSPTHRVEIHRRLGERLAAGYMSRAGEIAAELAMHFERGHVYDQALRYLADAADTAQRRVAYREVLDYATRGLALVEHTVATPERATVELRLRMQQVVAMSTLHGALAEGLEDAYQQTRRLCAQIEDPTLLGPVIAGLWNVAQASGSFTDAAELGGELHRLSRRHADPVLELEAHVILGFNDGIAGNPAGALEHFERGLELYDPDDHRGLAFVFGKDPAVESHQGAAVASWFLGYPDRARRHAEAACRLAHDLGYPTEIFTATSTAARIHLRCGNPQLVREYVAGQMRAYHRHGLTRSTLRAKIFDDWAAAQLGEPPSELALVPDGPAEIASRAIGEPSNLALEAETLAARGDLDGALELATEALASARRQGDLDTESMIVRLRGDLLVALASTAAQPDDSVEQAEQAFLEALEIARRQNAKSLELPAATSLARLWQSRGQVTEARELLAEVYGWFTEGFDTRDLQAAAALLTELETS